MWTLLQNYAYDGLRYYYGLSLCYRVGIVCSSKIHHRWWCVCVVISPSSFLHPCFLLCSCGCGFRVRDVVASSSPRTNLGINSELRGRLDFSAPIPIVQSNFPLPVIPWSWPIDLTIAPVTVILEYLIIIELVVSPRHRDIIILAPRGDCGKPKTPSLATTLSSTRSHRTRSHFS